MDEYTATRREAKIEASMYIYLCQRHKEALQTVELIENKIKESEQKIQYYDSILPEKVNKDEN